MTDQVAVPAGGVALLVALLGIGGAMFETRGAERTDDENAARATAERLHEQARAATSAARKELGVDA